MPGLDAERKREYKLSMRALEERCGESFGGVYRTELESLVDLIGVEPKNWPMAVRNYFIQPKWKWAARCTLFYFFMAHRLPPLKLAKWCATFDTLNNRSSAQHLQTLIRDFQNGKLANKTVYNHVAREEVPLIPPDWAHDSAVTYNSVVTGEAFVVDAGQTHFTDAIACLERYKLSVSAKH